MLLDPFLQRACSIELNYMFMSKVWTPEHCTCSQTIKYTYTDCQWAPRTWIRVPWTPTGSVGTTRLHICALIAEATLSGTGLEDARMK